MPKIGSTNVNLTKVGQKPSEKDRLKANLKQLYPGYDFDIWDSLDEYLLRVSKGGYSVDRHVDYLTEVLTTMKSMVERLKQMHRE